MTIYYYAPDNDRPSWGLGMIYYHVWLLNKNQIPAYIIHNKRPFKVSWLNLDIPIQYIEDNTLKILPEDTLVIPEFHASDTVFKKYKCRKIVFVQNAFYILDGLKGGKTYEDIGLDSVFYYMPHLKNALSQITTLPLYETPPFIAPYYYLNNEQSKRKKRILIYPKFENRDYNILTYILKKNLNLSPKNKIQKFFSSANQWELVELKGLKHHEVAKQMQEATFFISLNTNEAFNSAVPEAMAAGCINLCYEGYGPRDFLKNNENAFVFQNNYIYEMAEKLTDLITNFDNHQRLLSSIQQQAFSTANNYSIKNLEKALTAFFIYT